MEKVFFKNKRNQKLCGIIEDLGKDEIVIIVHGFGTSKDTSASLSAEELKKLGISSLRIDLNGCGESEGDFEKVLLSEYDEDLEAAIGFVKERGFKKISLIGTSLGGLNCFSVASRHPEIHRMVLRAPVADFIDEIVWKKGKELIGECKKRGYYEKYSRKLDKTFKIHYEFIDEAKNYIMYDKVKTIKCPILIIHGDADKETPLYQSKKIVKNLENGSLIIIEGADHGLKVNGDYSAGWEAFRDFFSNER